MKKIILSLICLCTSFLANAFSISPMSGNIEPLGSKKQMLFKVQNTSNQPLPIQTSSFLLSFDKEGKEVNTDTDDLFILPLTATIPANSFQTFIVKYIGEPLMPTSKNYRIAFETAHVRSENTSGVQMQYRFLTLLNVKPKNAFASVVQNRTYQKDNKWFLELTNEGNSYASLPNMKWQIGNEQNKTAVTKAELQKHFKFNMLQPNDTQSFEFTPLENIAPETMKVVVSN